MRVTRLLLPAVTALLSSCAYFIPPDNNAPRHNTVLGEPHRPELNVTTIGAPKGVNAVRDTTQVIPPAAPVQSTAAPVDVIARNDLPLPPLPPVDPAIQAKAEQEIAVADNAPAAAASLPSARRSPVENPQFEVAASGYPEFNAVPARPDLSGPDSAQSRLDAVQADLQQRRNEADASKAALTRDAAAEPSMLSDLPRADSAPLGTDALGALPSLPAAGVTVPPREELRSTPKPDAMNMSPLPPLPPTITASAPPSPERITLQQSAMIPPPVPNFPPPAPLNSMPQRPVAMAPLPTEPAPALAPVSLRAPVPVSEVAVAELPVPVFAPAPARAPAARRGDFDPLAAAANIPLAPASARNAGLYKPAPADISTGYIPPSRYAERRY